MDETRSARTGLMPFIIANAAALVKSGTVSDTPSGLDDHILDQVDRLHAAHRRGDSETAAALHRELVARCGFSAITSVMAARDVRDQVGVEVELLRLVGADSLYGRRDSPAA
ncbi:hypothetical protein [Nocardia salmonicida]|uniref:hypothetical protein n=1 Tax=Nocardia salmonicida TaxID=53431 RepID=UPI00378D8B10